MLQSTVSQRVEHDLVTKQQPLTLTAINKLMGKMEFSRSTSSTVLQVLLVLLSHQIVWQHKSFSHVSIY